MKKLVVLWTDGNKVSVENMIFMYTLNAKKKGWWEEVELIIWGAATELAASDEHIQELIKQMIQAGVNVRACKACAENLDKVQELESLGIEVLYIGQPFTEHLKDPETKVITL
ncbi:MAG: DsrE family protein [Dethiosulfatibacter sp.]|nr:DsrE family protein [Dethiosulfatibacter sp.]